MAKETSENLELAMSGELVDYIQVLCFAIFLCCIGAAPIIVPHKYSHQGKPTQNLVNL